MINNRANDTKVEREIARFLDINLYGKNPIFERYERTDKRVDQVAGSDVLLTTSDGQLTDAVVDEKVASRYANTRLDTFSLELSFMNRRGDLCDGWFVDEGKKTEYYLFGWLDEVDIPYDEEKHRFDTDSITSDKIRKMDWALVSRRRIVDFLEEQGWTMDRIRRQERKIRENGQVKTKEFVDGISFRYSRKYIEQPINLLMKKDLYFDLSLYHGSLVLPKI